MDILFFVKTTRNLPFKKYFDKKQDHDKKDKPYQNLVISFVEYFVQLSIFSIGINHCNYKSNKKTACKPQLTLTKHSLNFLCKFRNLFQKSY